jgi:hypothetical protein
MRIIFKISLLLLIWITPTTFAGSGASKEATLDPEEIIKFAKDVEKYAASKGARAFIISRLGTPKAELPKGINFTHTAVAVYSTIQLSDGKTVQGYAIHNLYQDSEDSNASSIIIDYPVDFFWSAFELKAGIIIPTPELQQLLLDNIANSKHLSLHNPNYSLLSNPFNSKYQNCTEYILDVINASIYQTTDIQQLKKNTQAHFKPKRIKRSLKLLLGRILKDDLTTKDHGRKIYTTTFSTIGNYLQDNNLASSLIVFQKDGTIDKLM